MPSIVTHNLFAKEVYNNLPPSIKEKITIPYYLLFAQSFDNLFYYKFLTPWQGKEIRKFGEQAQKENVNLYFKNLIETIKENNYLFNKEVLSYLYGSITHYILDSKIHPYIIYYAGDNHQKKYRGLHEKIEVNIDAYLYKEKTNKDLSKENLANTLLPILNYSKELKNTINNTYYKTFKKENMSSIYEKSVKMGNFLIKYGVTDKIGLKKQLYKLKDIISKNSYRKYEYLSFHVTKIYKEYLNEFHETWHNPADKKLTFNKSFNDLYIEALNKNIELIIILDKYFKNQDYLENVLTQLGNNSYVTGLPCDKDYTLKYFKN